MNRVNFNISIQISDDRAKEIQEETDCSIKEYYGILLKEQLENLLPKSGEEKLEITEN